MQSETKSAGHTPGPWEIRASEIGEGHCVYSLDGYGIGKAWDINSRPENLANARLIAAAPEMYEALRSVHKALCRQAPNDDALIDVVEAALAKAEGR